MTAHIALAAAVGALTVKNAVVGGYVAHKIYWRRKNRIYAMKVSARAAGSGEWVLVKRPGIFSRLVR